MQLHLSSLFAALLVACGGPRAREAALAAPAPADPPSVEASSDERACTTSEGQLGAEGCVCPNYAMPPYSPARYCEEGWVDFIAGRGCVSGRTQCAERGGEWRPASPRDTRLLGIPQEECFTTDALQQRAWDGTQCVETAYGPSPACEVPWEDPDPCAALDYSACSADSRCRVEEGVRPCIGERCAAVEVFAGCHRLSIAEIEGAARQERLCVATNGQWDGRRCMCPVSPSTTELVRQGGAFPFTNRGCSTGRENCAERGGVWREGAVRYVPVSPPIERARCERSARGRLWDEATDGCVNVEIAAMPKCLAPDGG